MAINVTFGGEVYSVPESGDRGWANLTDYLVSISQNALTAETFTQNIRQDSGAEVTVLTTDSIVIIDNTEPISITLPATTTEGKIYSILDAANTLRSITITNLSETFESNNNAIQIAFVDGTYKIVSNLSQIDANITVQVTTLEDTVGNLVEANIPVRVTALEETVDSIVESDVIVRVAELEETVDSIADTDIDNRFAIYMRDASGALVSTYQTSAIKLPTGTIAQRPAPQQGLFRYNSESGNVEVHNGLAWKQLNTTDLAGASLSDLNDVNVSNPQEGESLVWNGSAWVNQETIGDLSNEVITAVEVDLIPEVRHFLGNEGVVTLPEGENGMRVGLVNVNSNTINVVCRAGDTFYEGSEEGQMRIAGEAWTLIYINNKWYNN